MNEQRSDRVAGGLCVLLVVLLGIVGAIAFVRHRHATALAERVPAMDRALRVEMSRRQSATDLSADLSLKVRDLENRVGELEQENHELRERLAAELPESDSARP